MYHDVQAILKDELWTHFSEEEIQTRKPANLAKKIEEYKEQIDGEDSIEKLDYISHVCNVNYYGAVGVSLFGDGASYIISQVIAYDRMIHEENQYYGFEDDSLEDEIVMYMFIGMFQILSKGGAALLHMVFRDCLLQNLERARDAVEAANDNSTITEGQMFDAAGF
ncbi:MAG: hypothetical protein RLN62_03005 [Rickettsiales bacterium]